MTIFNYAASSPYSQTPQYTDRIGIFNPIAVLPDSRDTFITVSPKYTNNPMLLSQDTYGTPALYWIFSARNIDIVRDPYWDLIAGIYIAVPSISYLTSIGITI